MEILNLTALHIIWKCLFVDLKMLGYIIRLLVLGIEEMVWENKKVLLELTIGNKGGGLGEPKCSIE